VALFPSEHHRNAQTTRFSMMNRPQLTQPCKVCYNLDPPHGDLNIPFEELEFVARIGHCPSCSLLYNGVLSLGLGRLEDLGAIWLDTVLGNKSEPLGCFTPKLTSNTCIFYNINTLCPNIHLARAVNWIFPVNTVHLDLLYII
jgi:hypothetical protein